MDLELIKEEFNKYTRLFDKDNYDISYKNKHSNRVKVLSNFIAVKNNLSEEDITLATIIGLLHDIGRFKQLEMFGSYDDKNVDHADLGVKILFEDKLINNFKIDSKYYDIINFSIRNHNKLKIEDIQDDRVLMHSKIIRDADKLDIFKAFIIHKDYKLKETNDEISDAVKNDFYNNRPVDCNGVNNPNDKIILVLAFIFDINYKVSLDYIRKEKLIEKFYDSIENKELFEPYFKYAFKYLNERDD